MGSRGKRQRPGEHAIEGDPVSSKGYPYRVSQSRIVVGIRGARPIVPCTFSGQRNPKEHAVGWVVKGRGWEAWRLVKRSNRGWMGELLGDDFPTAGEAGALVWADHVERRGPRWAEPEPVVERKPAPIGALGALYFGSL